MIDFSSVDTPQIVNADFVLSKVSDSQIFYQYFGDFIPYKHVYNSVFRKDSKPSTGFYYNQKGKLVYKDFGTGSTHDCFAFVAELNNLTYGEAIKKVACDFGLIKEGCGNFTIERKVINKSEKFDNKIKEETIVQIVPDKWQENQLEYWDGYSISLEELEANRVFPVKKLFLNKKVLKDEENGLRFAYLLPTPKKEYLKIYSPFNNQYKWISNIPLHIPFGMDGLKYDSDTVIITKSVKDMIVLKKLFSNVIACQNESESALNKSMVSFLRGKFKKRIIIFDNDEVGKDNCMKFNKEGFGYFNIPNDFIKEGIKDPSDFVKIYGVDRLRELLMYKEIL